MSRHAAPPSTALVGPVRPGPPPVPSTTAHVPAVPELDVPELPEPAAGTGRARLFAAAVARPSVGGINPRPVVMLNGAEVFGALNGLGSPFAQTLVDRLRVEWGRTGVLDQAEPATATFSLFLRSRRWLVEQGNLIGAPVVIAHDRPNPTTGDNLRVIVYRGRVTRLNARRHTVRDPGTGETIAGLLVDVGTSSVMADLGSRIIASSPWPRESFPNRRARVAGLVADLLPGDILLRPYWMATDVGPADVDSRDALSIIRQLYDSTGDRMTYRPDTNGITYVQRRDYAVGASKGMGQLTYSADARGGLVYAKALNASTSAGLQVGGFLDADALVELDDDVSRDVASRITRVQAGYTNALSTPADQRTTYTYSTDDVNEAVEGRRVLSVDTIHAYSNWTALLASDLFALARNEGQAWRVPAFRWDTRATLGFETQLQVDVLLSGTEGGSVLFLQRSYLPELGLPPVFGVQGGVIEYRDGRWIVDVIPAPITIAPARWAQLQVRHASAPAFDPYLTPARCDPSLTVGDFEFITAGLGMTTTYADGEG